MKLPQNKKTYAWVVVVTDEEKVKIISVFRNSAKSKADAEFAEMREIYGSMNVCLASREIVR
jgi:hypothetical protein